MSTVEAVRSVADKLADELVALNEHDPARIHEATEYVKVILSFLVRRGIPVLTDGVGAQINLSGSGVQPRETRDAEEKATRSYPASIVFKTKPRRSFAIDYLILDCLVRDTSPKTIDEIQRHISSVFPDMENESYRASLVTKISRLRSDKEVIEPPDPSSRAGGYKASAGAQNYMDRLKLGVFTKAENEYLRQILGEPKSSVG